MAEQFGVITRRQLLAAGFTNSAIGRRMRHGSLIPLYRGVYALGHAALVPRGRALAAQLACGPDAALALGDAGAHMGLGVSGGSLWHVVVPGPAMRRRPGIRVRRTSSLPPGEVVQDGPIRHTSLARTALDLAATGPERHVRRLLREAEIRRLFDLADLYAVLARHPGAAGTRVLRAVLADLDPGAVGVGLQEDVLEFVRARGIRVPETEVPFGPYRVDFLWRAEGVVGEADDFASHGIRSNFEHEKTRAAWFAARRIPVVPVTARRLARDPDGFERDLRDALGSSVA